MIVADSSYLIEALLRNAELFSQESFVAPDLALYEIGNVLWRHETVIRDIEAASEFLSLLEELISAEAITLVRPDGELIRDAYNLSVRHKAPFYDTIFVVLALKLKLKLETFDKAQIRILSEEIGDKIGN